MSFKATENLAENTECHLTYSEITENVRTNASKSDIKNLRFLGDDLDDIKIKIENENTNNTRRGTIIGNFSEYVSQVGGFLRIGFFFDKLGVKSKLGRWVKDSKIIEEVKEICDIGAATNSGGGIDIALIEEGGNYSVFSSKIRGAYSGDFSLGKAEPDRMGAIIDDRNNDFFKSSKNRRGVIIYDKKVIKNETQNTKSLDFIFDWQDLKKIWKQAYALMEKLNFDKDEIDKAIQGDKEELKLWPHQQEGLDKCVSHYKSGKNTFLFDWICRSGKVIGALSVAEKMGFQRIAICTGFPSVIQSEWIKTLKKYRIFSHWQIIDFTSGKKYTEADIDFNKPIAALFSLQDLKSEGSDDNYGIDKEKLSILKKMASEGGFDCFIGDEVHDGFETEKTARLILDKIKHNRRLYLSATPFKNYYFGSFTDENSHRFSLLDEIKFAKEHPDSVYATFPKMVFWSYIFDLDQHAEYIEHFGGVAGITMEKLLSLEEDGEFRYKNELIKIFKFLFNDASLSPAEKEFAPILNDFNSIKGLRNTGNGIIIYAQRVAVLEKLAELLNSIDVIKEAGYYVDYTYSELRNDPKKLMDWAKKIQSHEKFILLAVGQFTTGTTLPEVDTIIPMYDGYSVTEYWQKVNRARNPKKGRTHVQIIDLNPTRTLRAYFEYARHIADGQKENQEKVFKEMLEMIPFYLKGKRFEKIHNVSEIFSKIRDEIINPFGSESLLNMEAIFSNREEFDEEISSLNVRQDDSTFNKEYDLGNTKVEKGKNYKHPADKNTKGGSGNGKDEEEEEKEDTIKQFKTIMSSFTWADVLTMCKYDDWEQIIDALDSDIEKREEFERIVLKDSLKEDLDMKKLKKTIKKHAKTKDLNSEIQKFNKKIKNGDYNVIDMILQSDKFKKLFGEVLTDSWIIDAILDLFPKEDWENKNLFWFDPFCGTGNFLYKIFIRLMESLKISIPEEKDRKKHILENMLYGMDIQIKNVCLSILRLDPENKYKSNLHVIKGDSLKSNFWNLDFDKIRIATNPPYNDEKKKSCNTKSIYPDCVDKASKMAKRFAMITPSRWFVATSHEDHCKKMINSYGLKYLKHFENNKTFKNTDIKGGLSFFLCEKGYDGDVLFEYDRTSEKRNFKKFGFILTDKRSETIIEKVLEKIKEEKLDLVSSSYLRNGHINTNDKRLKEKQDKNDLVCHASKGRVFFVDKNNIDLSSTGCGKYKAITYLAQGKGYDIIQDFSFCEKEAVSTSSFISFEFDTKKETEQFIKFMSLKLSKFLVSLRKSTQALTSTCFDFVPYIHKEILTDKDIYDYFKLTQEEIKLIEEMVK